ncbi:MAG: hypothetical protein ACHQ5A_00320 [Opitutales bacterium]
MKDKFSVLRFELQREPDGRYTQEVHRCGDFQSVESAFATARMEAIREWQEACENDRAEAPAVRRISIRDTEWGYELCRDHLVLARYWVHDGQPAHLPGISS